MIAMHHTYRYDCKYPKVIGNFDELGLWTTRVNVRILTNEIKAGPSRIPQETERSQNPLKLSLDQMDLGYGLKKRREG
jgi:hypothetical protein